MQNELQTAGYADVRRRRNVHGYSLNRGIRIGYSVHEYMMVVQLEHLCVCFAGFMIG